MNHIPESPVGIVGSRDFPDLEMVRAFVRSLPKDACVVSGGARGVDQAAESEALNRGLTVCSFRPTSNGHGQFLISQHICYGGGNWWFTPLNGTYPTFTKAAHTRNQMIVDKCVEESGSVVAYWDGESTGTKSTIDKAEAAGILFAVYSPDSVTRST